MHKSGFFLDYYQQTQLIDAQERGVMEQTKQVISSYADAFDNAVRFQHYLKNNEQIRHKLSQYKHWYYFPKQDIFAPSLFIGYKNNTYNSEAAHAGDGRETEKALAHFFRKLKPSDDQQDYYIDLFYDKLAQLLIKYGKKIKANSVIHIPIEHSGR